MIYTVAAATGHDPVTIETTWTLRQLYGVWDAVLIQRRMRVLMAVDFISSVFGSKKRKSNKGGR